MGKRHREVRKEEKKLVRLFHFKEDEFGERRRVLTKAELRRAQASYARATHKLDRALPPLDKQQMARDILAVAERSALDAITAQLDAELFGPDPQDDPKAIVDALTRESQEMGFYDKPGA